MKIRRIILLFLFVMFFFGGWHNIDNAWNLRFTNNLLLGSNITLQENSLFLGYGENEAYMTGVMMMFLSFTFFFCMIIDYEGDKYGKKIRRKSNT